MQLPDTLSEALAPLFEILPLEQAMPRLVGDGGASDAACALVKELVRTPIFAQNPALAAGIWLYVDDIWTSHTVSQDIPVATGSYWHGIMHRREGDFWNSHYWFNRVGDHPAMQDMTGYVGHQFVDAVDNAQPDTPADLVENQRNEWATLFAWCAAKADL